MKLARVGLALALLASACTKAQDKPKGYDFAACAPDGYYAVHARQDGKDLIVDKIIEEPGVVKTTADARYKFQEEKDGVSVYSLQAGEDKLVIKLNPSISHGLFYQNDKLSALLFMQEDVDGSKLAGFAQDHVKACMDALGIEVPDSEPSPDKKDI